MALVVQKYGGSSVADADSIKRVARRIVETQRAGNQVTVVVSAMGDSTDELMDLAQQVSPDPPGRELEALALAIEAGGTGELRPNGSARARARHVADRW